MKKLITNYSIDIKLAKASLLNSGLAPEFPDTEWKNVLLGLAVNLDTMFNGHYSTDHKLRHSEDLGDFTISTQEITTTKTIKSAGDWFIAWTWAAAAIACAFPHLTKSCDEYGKHILGLFGSFATEHHALILNYDKAVRKRVGLRRDLLLTDFADFSNLRVQFLDARGANAKSQVPPDEGRRSARRSTDACIRWNRGVCTMSSDRCIHQHICSHCRSPDHTISSCPVNSSLAVLPSKPPRNALGASSQ